MDDNALLGRPGAARVARLATAAANGRLHVVPICFALDPPNLYFAIDAKPKRTTDLKRLRNISANPSAAVLADHYEDHDWSRLWWVRADGKARVVQDPGEARHAMDLLEQRYEQYRRTPPPGPDVAIAIERVTGWTAS